MDRTIRTCSALAALALVAGAPAQAAPGSSLLAAYARARIAGSDGALDVSARAYAAVLAARPDDANLAGRAYRQALIAGDIALALRAAATLDRAGALPADGQLLLLTRAVRARDWRAAGAAADILAKDGSFDFLVPLLRAWIAHGSGQGDPFAILDAPGGSALTTALAAEQRALLLVSARRLDEAATVAQAQALAAGGGSTAIKLAVAARLIADGRKPAGLALLRGDDPVVAAARRLAEAGKPIRTGRLDAAGGVSALLARVAEAIQSDPRSPVGLTLARLATHLDPSNEGAAVLLARLLANAGQPDEALRIAERVSPASPYHVAAVDARVGILQELGRREEALAIAVSRANRPEASLVDGIRAADLYVLLDRHAEAAAAYERAIARVGDAPEFADRVWRLWLQAGGAHEQAGDWARARPALAKAVELAPNEAVALNYLGYAQLERRENVPAAMALIQRASALKPDDPAITDSLGWAYFLLGDVKRAIPTLEQAVQGQPGDPTINEHLGDAYWAAGRRVEARYAWRAAVLFAEESAVEARIRAKLDQGLTPALAAR